MIIEATMKKKETLKIKNILVKIKSKIKALGNTMNG